jgi:hypothetical protein
VYRSIDELQADLDGVRHTHFQPRSRRYRMPRTPANLVLTMVWTPRMEERTPRMEESRPAFRQLAFS